MTPLEALKNNEGEVPGEETTRKKVLSEENAELVNKILEEIAEEHAIFGKRLTSLVENSKTVSDIAEGMPKLKRSSADLKASLKKLSAL